VSADAGGRSAAPPAVRVIVLNHQGGDLVIDAVESVTRLDWPADRLDIVVVDNASTDGSDVEVECRFPSARVVRSPANIGFTANNLALRDLDGVDYVGLVNNDATVEPGWLRTLVEELESDASVGAACPRILFAPTFAGATITAPTFRPRGDRRDLGVRLSGIRSDGRDAWESVRFGLGFYGEEPGPRTEPRFRWMRAAGAAGAATAGAGGAADRAGSRAGGGGGGGVAGCGGAVGRPGTATVVGVGDAGGSGAAGVAGAGAGAAGAAALTGSPSHGRKPPHVPQKVTSSSL
jgi:Glycosyl transferase family 2